MNVKIFYFSGTGNSLAVAKDIAKRTGAELFPIASLKDETAVNLNGDAIGIVFPVYYAQLPVIVKEFAEKLTDMQNKYVFAVCTHGGAAMSSLRRLKSKLRERGVQLSAAYGVHMPQNSFLKPREDRMRILSRWRKKLDLIVKNTGHKSKGLYYEKHLLELLIIPFLPMIKSICRKAFLKQTGLPVDTPFEKLVRHMDSGFIINEKCNGCGICAKVCPVGNIRLNQNIPEWLHSCENCLACYNWCPSHAIQGGITSDYFYRHPETKMADMARQKKSI